MQVISVIHGNGSRALQDGSVHIFILKGQFFLGALARVLSQPLNVQLKGQLTFYWLIVIISTLLLILIQTDKQIYPKGNHKLNFYLSSDSS